jgi:hypothetical protein
MQVNSRDGPVALAVERVRQSRLAVVIIGGWSEKRAWVPRRTKEKKEPRGS